jgi:hypothetical protein
MGSGAVIYIQSFIKIGSGVQKLIRGDTQTHTHGQQRDLISLLYFFKIMKEILVFLICCFRRWCSFTHDQPPHIGPGSTFRPASTRRSVQHESYAPVGIPVLTRLCSRVHIVALWSGNRGEEFLRYICTPAHKESVNWEANFWNKHLQCERRVASSNSKEDRLKLEERQAPVI